MKNIALLAASTLLLSSAASAGSNWHSINLNVSPADAPKVVAALDALMKSVGGDLKGDVALMAYVAYGQGATSHNIISSFESRAERETFLQKMYASDAWKKYTKATRDMTELAGMSRMNFLKSWGEEDPADVFWEIHGFAVDDPEAFAASLDALMTSKAGKAFPGSVYLSAVAAAGISPVTHLISVGFRSEAEAETASAAMNATEDWARYLDASRKAGSLAGSYMLRTIKNWGGNTP